MLFKYKTKMSNTEETDKMSDQPPSKEGLQLDSDDNWSIDSPNVWVRFANGLGSGKAISGTIYYKLKGDRTTYTQAFALVGPSSIPVQLNYIDKIDMGVDGTADINLGSKAFDGQRNQAYFNTMIDCQSGGYKVQWKSDGELRGEWAYGTAKDLDDSEYDIRNASNVRVYFKNEMTRTMNATIYFKVQHDNRQHSWGVSYDKGDEGYIDLNFIDRIEMGRETAYINLSSNAFDGQISTAYFITFQKSTRYNVKDYVKWVTNDTEKGEWRYS